MNNKNNETKVGRKPLPINKKSRVINVSLHPKMIDFIEKEIEEKSYKSYAECIREIIREKMN